MKRGQKTPSLKKIKKFPAPFEGDQESFEKQEVQVPLYFAGNVAGTMAEA